MLNEIINQGFLEVGLNTFLETMLPQRPFRGKTLIVNIVAALISYFFLQHFYKGHFLRVIKTSDKLKKLGPILLLLDLFLFSSYGLSLEFFSHVMFIFTFVFLTCFFKNIFTFCEVYLMADMHARFLEIYLEGYHVDSSLIKISNLLVISHCMNILLYLFMHIIKPSKLHGFSAFGLSVALILGINGFNIFLMLKELFSETAWLNTLSIWVCVLFAGVPIIFWLQKKQLVRNIIIRKFFHFQTVIMFSFGIIYTPLLMKVAFSVAIFLFISLEALRISLRDHFSFVLKYESFVKTFIDERDNERLIYTHIFLLLGCAYPFLLDWKSYNTELKSLLTKLAGILILGVGDSMAAIIGSKYGRLKKFIHPKSYEGLFAGIISMLLFIVAVILVYFPIEFGDIRKLIMIIIATVIVGLLEAVTKQNDNLALPITYYNLLMALL